MNAAVAQPRSETIVGGMKFSSTRKLHAEVHHMPVAKSQLLPAYARLLMQVDVCVRASFTGMQSRETVPGIAI